MNMVSTYIIVFAAAAGAAAEPGICYLNADDFSCAVPGVEPICCTIAKALVPCATEDAVDVAGCKAAVLEKLSPQLTAAGVDTAKLADEAYQKKLCPVMAGVLADDKIAKMYCSPRETCNFTGSIGLMKYDCSVENTVKSCCDLTKAMSDCGDDKECITNVFLEADGFDIVKMQDPAYAKSRCPVLAAFGGDGREAAIHKNCKINMGDAFDSSLLTKADCSFATDEFSCTVPDVKKVCCTVTKAVLPCGVDPSATRDACRGDVLSGDLLPQLQAAGAGSDTAGFCPVMEGMHDKSKQEEYCKPSPAAAPAGLFSLFKPGDALTSAPVKANMAFGVFCGVAVVASFAVVVRRRWQTSVATHEPLEVELQAEQGLVD